MPHKNREARKAYRNSYYKKRIEQDATYRERLNKARNSHDLICEQCQKPFKGRKGKRFCSQSCATKWQWANGNNKSGGVKQPGLTGQKHPLNKGGTINSQGYRLVYAPDHPTVQNQTKSSRKYVLEHRLVMETALGRYLEPWEQVHHKNSDRLDNRAEN